MKMDIMLQDGVKCLSVERERELGEKGKSVAFF